MGKHRQDHDQIVAEWRLRHRKELAPVAIMLAMTGTHAQFDWNGVVPVLAVRSDHFEVGIVSSLGTEELVGEKHWTVYVSPMPDGEYYLHSRNFLAPTEHELLAVVKYFRLLLSEWMVTS